MSETTAIEINSERVNVIDIHWESPEGTGIDMTGYTLTGSIDWIVDSMSITSYLAYTTQASGQLQLTLQETQAALLPKGTASTISVTATIADNEYHLLECHPVLVE